MSEKIQLPARHAGGVRKRAQNLGMVFFFFYIYGCGRSRNSKRKTITGGNTEGVIRQLGKELGEFRATKPREGEPQGVSVLGAAAG